MEHKEKIVIIGGTGFIGEALTNKLERRDNCKLSVIYRNTPPEVKFPAIDYHQIDGSIEGERLGQIVSFSDYLVLLHQPDEKLIQNLIKFGTGIKKIIFASTMLLYSDSEIQQSEDAPLVPLTEYEKKKVIEEQLLTQYTLDQKASLCIPRLANVYGDIKNRGIVQKIFNVIMNGEQFRINGDGGQIRDYIFINDVTNALERLLFLEQKNDIEIYNICTGFGCNINNLIRNIETITGKILSCQNGPALQEKHSVLGDPAKISSLLPTFPEFTLQNGLEKTYENYSKANQA